MLGVNQHLIIMKRLPMCKTPLGQWQAWRYSPGLKGPSILLETVMFLKTLLGFDKKSNLKAEGREEIF